MDRTLLEIIRVSILHINPRSNTHNKSNLCPHMPISIIIHISLISKKSRTNNKFPIVGAHRENYHRQKHNMW